jgi:putative ABC transport system ATP-binding protein
VIELEGMSCIRGHGDSAFGVSIEELSVMPGETLVITGPSGSGKSTLLEILALVLRPTTVKRFQWLNTKTDSTQFDIKDLWRNDQKRQLASIRAQSVGYVMQTGGLIPYLDVKANILIWRRIAAKPDGRETIAMLVNALDLGDLLGKKPQQLSVGERQRVAIARALAHEPVLLLADEPTAALDPLLADRVFGLMLNLVQRLGSIAIIVSHDYARVRNKSFRELRAIPYETGNRRGSCFEEYR